MKKIYIVLFIMLLLHNFVNSKNIGVFTDISLSPETNLNEICQRLEPLRLFDIQSIFEEGELQNLCYGIQIDSISFTYPTFFYGFLFDIALSLHSFYVDEINYNSAGIRSGAYYKIGIGINEYIAAFYLLGGLKVSLELFENDAVFFYTTPGIGFGATISYLYINALIQFDLFSPYSHNQSITPYYDFSIGIIIPQFIMEIFVENFDSEPPGGGIPILDNPTSPY